MEYRLDTTKFYKLHTFRESLYFDEPSWTLDIVKNDMPVRPVVFDASDLERAMKMKKSTDMPLRKPVVKHAEKTVIVEVDLHASALLDTTAGLTSSEILDYQWGKSGRPSINIAMQRGVKSFSFTARVKAYYAMLS